MQHLVGGGYLHDRRQLRAVDPQDVDLAVDVAAEDLALLLGGAVESEPGAGAQLEARQ